MYIITCYPVFLQVKKLFLQGILLDKLVVNQKNYLMKTPIDHAVVHM